MSDRKSKSLEMENRMLSYPKEMQEIIQFEIREFVKEFHDPLMDDIWKGIATLRVEHPSDTIKIIFEIEDETKIARYDSDIRIVPNKEIGEKK